MNWRFTARAAAAIGLIALLGACASCGPAGGGPDAGRGPPGGMRGGPPSEMGGRPRGAGSAVAARQMLIDQSAAQLASVRARLSLTAAQAPAWDAYAASIGALLADLARDTPIDAHAANALQRVDLRVDVARNRYAALENVADAMRRLYAMLDDEQRPMADRVLAGTVPSLYGGGLMPAGGEFDARPAGVPGPRGDRPQRSDRRPM